MNDIDISELAAMQVGDIWFLFLGVREVKYRVIERQWTQRTVLDLRLIVKAI